MTVHQTIQHFHHYLEGRYAHIPTYYKSLTSSSGKIRQGNGLFIPKSLHKMSFENLYSVSHPSIKVTCRFISKYYIFPGINRDTRDWICHCLPYQKAKVVRWQHFSLFLTIGLPMSTVTAFIHFPLAWNTTISSLALTDLPVT